MSSHYKEIPTLTSLLRRRNMTVTQWCQENKVATLDMAECLCADNGLTLDPVASELVQKAIVREELKLVVDEVHDKAERSSSLPKHMQEAEARFGIQITPRTDLVDPRTGKSGELMYDITVPEASKGSKKKGRRFDGDTADEGTRDSLAVPEGKAEKKD